MSIYFPTEPESTGQRKLPVARGALEETLSHVSVESSGQSDEATWGPEVHRAIYEIANLPKKRATRLPGGSCKLC